jgi:hypothetical protein
MGYQTHRFCILESKTHDKIWKTLIDDWRRENKDKKYTLDFLNSHTFKIINEEKHDNGLQYRVYFCIHCNIIIDEIMAKYNDLKNELNELYLGYQEYKEGNIKKRYLRYLND